MEGKIKALKEVEQIYRLSKKWRRNFPDEKRPNFERMADNVFRKAMDMKGREDYMPVDVRAGAHMHEHDPRSARLIERTLATGDYGPDALSSFQVGRVLPVKKRERFRRPGRQRGDYQVTHRVQHVATDLVYPHGHLQGKGFVPRMHDGQIEHKQLKPVANQAGPEALPTTDSLKTSYA